VAQDGACPGVCNNQYRKAREAYKAELAAYDPLDPEQSRPEPLAVVPWLGDPVWCGRCRSAILQCLSQLDYLACIYQAHADGHGDAAEGVRVSGSQENPSPSQSADDADEIARMLGGWEEAYRDVRGWPAPKHDGDLAAWVTECSSWLITHLGAILSSPIAKDFGEEILGWHREITGKAKAGTRKLRKPMRCPSCALLTLEWTEGEDTIRCGNRDCGRVLTTAEYEAEVERRVAGMRNTA
jgi:hypothetical protein